MFCDYIHVLDICSVIKGQKKRMIKISWAFNVKPNKKKIYELVACRKEKINNH